MPKYNLKEWGSSLLLYGLCYILLIEWLLPLPYITDTGFITLFMLAVLAFFIVNFLKLPTLLIISVKFFVILYGLHYMFIEGSPFWSLEWIGVLLEDISQNMYFLFTGQIHYLTDLFRSLLFFVLLSVMSYLLFYWAIRVKRIMFFLIFTMVYITVIDTFTPYDATYSIVRIFMIGFLLLGLVRMYRTIERGQVTTYSSLLPLRLIASLSFVIMIASVLGFLGPKFEPKWDDPVPFLRAAVGVEGELGIQRIGYGDNDEQLGGGIEYDETPIFYAYASKGQYWRGETKNYYTGRGWEVSTPPGITRIPNAISGGEVDLELLEATVVMSGNQLFSHVFYPGEVFDIKTYSGHAIDIWREVYTGKVNTFYRNEGVELYQYTLHYEDPSFSVTKLRNSTENDPFDIQEHYLQLPNGLPLRIQELTEEIISGQDNRYDQVKAVERYFARAGFRYETKDVGIPQDGEDYVDQFLFETQQGYCDNFSTSMAVMLRSVGIPTRWVKGFTSGKRISTEEGIHEYEVTSANAHSWVEVYFPEYGWVPFEPTRGFSNSNFNFELDQMTPNDREWEREEQEERELQELEQEENVQPVTAPVRENAVNAKSKSSILEYLMYSFITIGFIVIIILLWIFRRRFKMMWMKRRFQKGGRVESIEDAYEKLTVILASKGLTRANGETLREFAKRVDEAYAITDTTQFITIYEQIFYGATSNSELSDEKLELWENLINKITS